MGGISSHVVWRQTYEAAADLALTQVLEKLRCEVRELPSQQWDPGTASIGGVRDYQCSYVSPGAPEWSSVLLHHNALIGDALMGERLAAELSRFTSGPSVVFYEYDQATWGYTLYNAGTELDRFWSVPEIVQEDAVATRGTPVLVSGLFGVPESAIAPYLRHLDSELPETSKAFPDDEFALTDHWVRVDFMRRLGLQYPAPGSTSGGRYVQIVESQTPVSR